MNWDAVIMFGTIVLAIPGLVLLVIDMGMLVSTLQVAAHDYFSTKCDRKREENRGKK